MTAEHDGDRATKDEVLAAPHDVVQPHALSEQRQKLARLMRLVPQRSGEIADVLGATVELVAEMLGVQRMSVWQWGADGSSLDCIELFETDQARHSRGQRLSVRECTGYIAALSADRVLSSADAQRDPRTAELAASYLSPLGIVSLLDAPVYARGHISGVVCAEHVGKRRAWQLWEELLVGTLADFVAHVHQARDQLRVEIQLREMRNRVDEVLESRTNQVVRENADLQREVDALQVAAEAIRRSEEDLRRLFAASPAPMLLVRRSDKRLLLANEKAAEALRCAPADLRGVAASELFIRDADYRELLETVPSDAIEDSREMELSARNGDPFYALVSARDVSFSGDDTIMVGFTDLTAQKAVEHQLRSLAQRDPLTQAYNRHHFWQLANAEMARVRRYGRPLALAMIDADHFKAVNDVHGHDVGDFVLRTIVDTCHESLRKNDVLARYGGEEFVVMLPETQLAGAAIVMERVRERVAAAEMTLESGQVVRITVSIGLAELSPDEGLEELLKRADDALYAAKHAGRNQVFCGAP